MLSNDLNTLNSHFNANAYDPEDLPSFLQSISIERKTALKKELILFLKESETFSHAFYEATACTARDEKSARRFFEDVYKYAFEDGEEPDITDYWDRPKPSGWDAPDA